MAALRSSDTAHGLPVLHCPAEVMRIDFLLLVKLRGSLAGPVQSAVVDRRGAGVHGLSRRSPRSSDSRETMDSAAQRTFRKAIPVSTERRQHTSTTAVVTSAAASAAAAAAAGRVDRPRLAHPGAEPTGAGRAASPATGTTHRATARSNRSSDLRMARRDTAATSSRPAGELPAH